MSALLKNLEGNLAVQALPKIARLTGVERVKKDETYHDDRPRFLLYCPHCGARGKKIYWFVTEEGQTGGAMSGCIKLFPVGEYFNAYQKAVDNMIRFEKNGWNPSRFDLDTTNGIDLYFDGKLSKERLDSGLRDIYNERQAYLEKMGYKRRR